MGVDLSGHARVPLKATTPFLHCAIGDHKPTPDEVSASIIGLQSPHEGSNKSSPHEYLFTEQGPAKTNKYTLQGSISHKNHAK